MTGVERVVVVSSRRPNAEALAACLRHRGLATSIVEPRSSLPDTDAVVFDLTSAEAEIRDFALATAPTGIRAVGLGGDPRQPCAAIDAWVDPSASLDGFVAAIRGVGARDTATRRCPPLADRGSKLTPREEQVLSELLVGGGTAVVAERLGISPQTLRTHVQNVLAKLGLNTRAQAVVWALHNGVLSVEHHERRVS
jgi:DNA-binding CsgD family transcriptional regulator